MDLTITKQQAKKLIRSQERSAKLSTTTLTQQNDLVWKQSLHLYLKEFIEFFWPKAYQEINWDKKPDDLEKELLKLNIKDRLSNCYVDKLFKVYLKNGTEQWLLLHIEIQHSNTTDFEYRMFQYSALIHIKYHHQVASLAILADNNPNWRPDRYCSSIWGCDLMRSYNVVKILDYKGREAYLRTTNNLFGLIVLAQLHALLTSPDQEARLISKIELYRDLLKHGWSKENIVEICKFIENLLVLIPNLEEHYTKHVIEYEEEHQMRLMLTAEKVGYWRGTKEGISQGISQGMAKLLINLLQLKFTTVPEQYCNQINNADPQTLEKWTANVLTATTITEVF